MSHGTRPLTLAVFTLIAIFLVGGLAVAQGDKDKKEIAEISKALGGKALTFHETTNFVWAAALPKGKLRKIASEAERCYALFASEAGIKTWSDLWNGNRKCMGVVLGNRSDYKRYVRWYAKKYPVWDKEQFENNHSGSNWFAHPSERNIMVTHLKPNDAEAVGAVMCHLLGHLFVDRYKFGNNFTPGWLRESFGVYLQAEVHGKIIAGNYVDPYGLGSGDVDRQKGLKKSAFKARAKKNLPTGRLRNLKSLFSFQVENEMEFEDTQKGHILLSWMLKKPGKFAKFIKVMKRKWPGEISNRFTPEKEKAQNAALKEVFDVTPSECDRELLRFAKSGY